MEKPNFLRGAQLARIKLFVVRDGCCDVLPMENLIWVLLDLLELNNAILVGEWPFPRGFFGQLQRPCKLYACGKGKDLNQLTVYFQVMCGILAYILWAAMCTHQSGSH